MIVWVKFKMSESIYQINKILIFSNLKDYLCGAIFAILELIFL